jgi:hypothetical protein
MRKLKEKKEKKEQTHWAAGQTATKSLCLFQVKCMNGV